MRISDWSSDVCSSDLLFHEKGFAATTIDDIIERIGGSRGTLYIYFGSKLELFETIVREEADRFSKTLDDAFAMGADDMALEEATQKLLDLAQSEDAIGLLRMVDRKSTRLNSSH